MSVVEACWVQTLRVGRGELKAQIEGWMTQSAFYISSWPPFRPLASGMGGGPTGRAACAAHKGAFCFSSPHGSSTLLGNSLGADIISLSTEWKKEYLSACAFPSLPPSLPAFSHSLSLSASLCSSGALLCLLLRAIYAKGARAVVRLWNVKSSSKLPRSPKTRVWLSAEGARLRLNSSPPGNQEVGGPDREGSSSQAVSRWMNGSLSGAW